VLSDRIVVRVTQDPGRSFLDRMIALVEGAKRQKTPSEIALSILLAGLTLVFLFATVTLSPFARFAAGSSGGVPSMTVLVALLVCLIPTTIGGLLSAIGIAGMVPAAATWVPPAPSSSMGRRTIRARPSTRHTWACASWRKPIAPRTGWRETSLCQPTR
jgi:hypothetical protein